MKITLKLEELALLFLFSIVYFQFFQGSWGFYLALFFAPDLASFFYFINPKWGAIAYNILHHKGVMSGLILLGLLLQEDLISKIGLIFIAHSCFDRVAGYGLKYFDSFDHTHLGWIGKSKAKNDAS